MIQHLSEKDLISTVKQLGYDPIYDVYTVPMGICDVDRDVEEKITKNFLATGVPEETIDNTHWCWKDRASYDSAFPYLGYPEIFVLCGRTKNLTN